MLMKPSFIQFLKKPFTLPNLETTFREATVTFRELSFAMILIYLDICIHQLGI